MADNVGYTPGAGATVAADDIGGAHFQRVKIVLGSDGTNLGDVDVTRQMPVSGTVTVAGSVAVSGTAVVSVVPGVSVTAQVSGTVSVLNIVPVTTQASVSVSGLPVWMNPTQGVTILGTQLASIVPGVSVTLPQVSVLSTIVTILGTQIVSVVPGVSVSAVVSGTVAVGAPLNTVIYTTTQATGVTGMLVYMAQSQTMNLTVTNTVTITATDVARTQVMILVTSTVAAAGTTLLFTVYQGATQTVAGVALWVVPAGKTFRVLSLAIGVAVSITTTPVYGRLAVIVSAATPTWTSAIGQVARIGTRCSFATAPSYAAIDGLSQDVAAGLTVAIGMTATTATTFLTEGLVMGYLYP